MLGFNFLSMENYAPVEGFTSKKEKFTADELDALMETDEDTTTTTSNSTTTTMVDNDEETTTTMVDNVDTEELETTTTMVDDDEETTTTMVDDDEETTTTMVNDDEETTTTMVDNDEDEDEDEFGNVTSESAFENVGGEEGFVGSTIIKRHSTRSILYLILCIGLVYVAIKLMGVYQKKRMNMVYKKVKFLKLNKLNLDTDLVLSVVVGGLVYLIGMRMGWF
jgi:hypothetical protein